jgi:hypothetical protein
MTTLEQDLATLTIMDLELDLATYLELCSRVPSYHPDHGPLYDALRRGDTERVKAQLCRGLWLLVCHAYEPLFAAAYGSPHVFKDPDTGELKDVWQPVIEDCVRRQR